MLRSDSTLNEGPALEPIRPHRVRHRGTECHTRVCTGWRALIEESRAEEARALSCRFAMQDAEWLRLEAERLRWQVIKWRVEHGVGIIEAPDVFDTAACCVALHAACRSQLVG